MNELNQQQDALVLCNEIISIITKKHKFNDETLLLNVKDLMTLINKNNNDKTKGTKISRGRTLSDPGGNEMTEVLTTTSDRDISTLIYEGKHLIKKNQPLAAINILKRVVNMLKKRVSEGDDIVIDKRVVGCYQKMGDCYGMLKEYDEVRVVLCLIMPL